MNEQLVNQWASALRSGEYKQVFGTLKGLTNDGQVGYCCLGVLQSLRGEEPELCVIDEETTFLYEGPETVYKSIKELLGSNITDKLITMNDEEYCFPAIAYIIEEEFDVNT